MKKRLLLRIASAFGVAMMFVALAGCKHDPTFPQDETPLQVKVQKYLEHNRVEEVDPKFAQGYSAYFDISNGMPKAYEIKENRDNLETVTKLITGDLSQWMVYSLASDKITQLDFSSQNDVFKSITDAQYTEIKAPIDNALNKIVNEDKLALLVTDFEEYQTSDIKKTAIIYQAPYAKDEFEKWICKGGVIKFYIMKFVENQSGVNLDKKLFFVVFDNKDMELSSKIDKQFELQHASGYEEYVLKGESYRVYNDYKGGNGGNYNGLTNPMSLKYFGLYKDLEFYNMGNPWYSVFKYLYQAKQKDKACEGLLSGLYLDLSNADLRNINRLELKVTDITDDLKAYSQHEFAMSFKPEQVENEDGKMIFDIDPNSEAAFFFNEEGLKPEYEYKPKEKKELKTELLEINQSVFEESRKNSPEKTKIVVDFSKVFYEAVSYDAENVEFNWSNKKDLLDFINSNDEKVLQVDVCVAETDFNDNQKLKELFDYKSNVWETKSNNTELGNFVKNKLNDCISQSIQQVLTSDKLNYKGKVIYTYIIKSAPTIEEE